MPRELRIDIRRPLAWGLLLSGGLLAMGCQLEEVSLTEPETVLVAEVYVKAGDGPDQVTAFLQWTLGGEGDPSLGDAALSLAGPRGIQLNLVRAPRDLCLDQEILEDVAGVCFVAQNLVDGLLRAGDHLEVEIALPGGEELRGGVTLPGDFDILRPGEAVCALPPGVPLEMIWNPAGGAWAYAGRTLIVGLRDALKAQGIQAEEDSLDLVGFSIAETDTTLVFPQEFGIFDRFDLDRDVALALQTGLPLGASADVVVAALERNYVNWIRGGNFNPSGAVRVPSLRGDGIGVLGGVFRRTVRVVGAVPDGTIPSCLPGY
jgi:hypothetical protein